MNTDAFFAVGRQHHICQDYAIAGKGVAALSDGCSSSPNTDLGARFLCRLGVTKGPHAAIHAATSLLAPLDLPKESLDATLLLARWDDPAQSVKVFIAGDGVLVGRRRDGGSTVIVSEFPSGAPFYLNYGTNDARRQGYLQEFGGKHVFTVSTPESETVQESQVEEPPVVMFEFLASTFDLVLLLSDGAKTFRRPVPQARGATEPVPLQEVVDNLLQVKGYVGEFITRRAKRFLQDATARGWHHDDDFSVAAIHLGDPS